MKLFKNILIFILSSALAAFFVYGSFVFGMTATKIVKTTGLSEVKKSLVSIVVESNWRDKLSYSKYTTGTTSTGVMALDFGRLSTAFAVMKPFPNVSLSWSNVIQFKDFQGIFSLYDPFSIYEISPLDKKYGIKQITNGSIYISDEPDGTVSIYSIDAVVELSFFDQWKKMTDMILFPGMYIRFDPQANKDLLWADLFRIMLVLGDEKNDKNTGLEFVNPRVDGGKWEDIFFMYKLPTSSRPLFQMLHLLFRERINQVDLVKSYSTNYTNNIVDDRSLIINPSKKNYYLLDDLQTVLSRAVMTQMDGQEFREKVDKIYEESKILVKGNSINNTLERFLTDTRFATFAGNIQHNQLDTIYKETASILGITPAEGKWKFFQYLSDIYSKNIITRRKDPTFSGIDTYTPTAAGLARTLDNQNIESKDYFDITLYAYQILKKAQDGDMFTEESLTSGATYELIETLFWATEKYIQWISDMTIRKWAYQTLVVQFYAPLSNALAKSLYKTYTLNEGGYVYLKPDYIEWEVIKLDPKMKDSIESVFYIFNNTYERLARFYDPEDQKYALISFHDAVIRIGAFAELVTDGEYRSYQKNPYIGIDVYDIFMPSISISGEIERKQTSSGILSEEIPQPTIAPILTTEEIPAEAPVVEPILNAPSDSSVNGSLVPVDSWSGETIPVISDDIMPQ